jgi:hypothetical protein
MKNIMELACDTVTPFQNIIKRTESGGGVGMGVLFVCFPVLEIKPMALHMQDKCFMTKLQTHLPNRVLDR